ncbi:PREDICTED: gamma-glutamyltranspeptidase 1-like [Ceratosolen solmsi marchali]|uniref:Gamma-glutamyltranspeptidase 1-like n=1 Tax=Ceratosolen solmsi marchali TaxID=326594 RepID=A0AAJ6VKU5_9HYME|nr:PREDICTED: gamma-glutamyltranspeptidase 1-like [Ceratosolen solmsi marchali]
MPRTNNLKFETLLKWLYHLESSSSCKANYFPLCPSNLSSLTFDYLADYYSLKDVSYDPGDMGLCPRFHCYWHKPWLTKRLVTMSGFGVAGVLLGIILIVSLFNGKQINQESNRLMPSDPEQQLPPSWSKLRMFKQGAVCADGAPCALIGKSMLDRNGSAIDAAIASLICNGLINMQSMGFGGGFLMTIYEREKKQAIVLNARDTAPAAAHTHMFEGKSKYASRAGGLSILVPGELAGYWEAHQRFGKLPWNELFQPSIDLCDKGYNLTKVQYDGLNYNVSNIYQDSMLKEIFVNKETGEFYKPGSIIRPKTLCQTMRTVAEKNATEFYNGTLGKLLVEDIQKRGSIITIKDLNDYRVKWQEPVATILDDGTKVYTTGLPGSGGLLAFMLNVLNEFQFSPIDLADTKSIIRTYHRIIETYKYAYALRTQLGDVNLSVLFRHLTSKEYARSVRMMISDNKTWYDPVHYGVQNLGNIQDHGTAQISVIDQNGNAVSVTSSINIYFGSGIMSKRTGVLLNSGMDDFGFPGIINYFGIPSNQNNYIAPGKRPLSSMSPTILTDSNGDVKMVIGAAGGTKITTSIAYVIARHLWMGNSIKEAVDAPRIHHQLIPMEVSYEYGVPKSVIDGLKALGHKTSRYRDRGSVVCILIRNNNTIYANADYRKGGDVYGIGEKTLISSKSLK